MSNVPAEKLCPSCGDLIAAGAPGCRRCGYDTTSGAAPRPIAPPMYSPYSPQAQHRVFVNNPVDDKPMWQEVAFKIMAIMILILGVIEVIVGIALLAKSGGVNGGPTTAYGAVSAVTGVGLLAEWSFASWLVRIYCWVNFVVWGIITMLSLLAAFASPVLWLFVLLSLAVIGFYAFMLYLVNTVGAD